MWQREKRGVLPTFDNTLDRYASAMRRTRVTLIAGEQSSRSTAADRERPTSATGLPLHWEMYSSVSYKNYTRGIPLATSSPKNNHSLDISTLEGWLWEAACKIRGEIDAPKYKDYILPLIFLKRLSDVFGDEVNKLEKKYGSAEIVEKILAEDHSLVRFYLPPETRWEDIARKSSGLGEYVTDAMRSIARENPKLQGSIDIVDFNATAAGQRIIADDTLKLLIGVLGKHRLGLLDVEPDLIGRAYEYLLRKFAEGSGQSAGEYYTPREVGYPDGTNPQPETGGGSV